MLTKPANAINAPQPITFEQAQSLFDVYTACYNRNLDNSTNVLFGLNAMIEMLTVFQTEGADHVRVYFGAELDSDPPSVPYFQTTVFFQAAKADENDPTFIEDLPASRVAAYNLGHPCPPPKCPGRSIYYAF